MIKNFEQLNQMRDKCASCLNAKFTGKDGQRHVVLCGGTGCLSSRSDEITAEFNRLIAEKGLTDKVTVNQAGCFGFCSQGPFVKIYPEDTLYRLVQVEDVAEIVEKDLIGGEIIDRLLYVDPNTAEKITKQEDINLYKKQVRISLHGCGSINPENIEESLGSGAFQGLARALQMDRAAVIEEVLGSGLRGRGGGGFP
ncbi:MAG: NAD(P)H-dependent oxidoreductase subunit E, partial [Clostridia bacterium]|nr:NAD(P)H-dependent oxidoreductase subunit E [Clostridia bacterium]